MFPLQTGQVMKANSERIRRKHTLLTNGLHGRIIEGIDASAEAARDLGHAQGEEDTRLDSGRLFRRNT